MPSGAGDDVAARVGAGLVLADVTGVDQFLHVAVVERGSVQLAVAQEIGARVADVDQREAGDIGFVGAEHHQRGQRGSHALVIGAGVRCLEDRGVGFDDGGDDDSDVAGTGSQPVADDARGDVAGDFAGLMSAHAIGDTEDHRLGDEGVFVPGAHLPDIGRRAPAHRRLIGERDVIAHYSASNTVLPICTRSPLATRSWRCDALAVEIGAVGRTEILDHGRPCITKDTGVQLRHERVVGHADGAR